MARNRYRGFTVNLNQTSFKRIVVSVVIGIIAMFIFVSMLTSMEPGYGLASSSIHEWAADIKGEHLLHLLGQENNYFTQVLPPDSEPPNLSTLAFQIATSINPDDPRSLLGRELPGFALFDGHIVVAGEGTNYTNLPVESAPPIDVIMAERQATQESLAKLEELERESKQLEETTDGRKIVHIIHSHNYESYLPELDVEDSSDPNLAFHNKVNITLVGEKMSQELEKRGIGTEVEKRDVQGKLKSRGWNYGQSYDASRELVKEAIAANEDLQFFFDLHRDSQRRERTTVTINGVEYARTFFVIGANHSDYQHNLKLAEDLHKLLQERYPGLSRGVITKGGSRTNGLFNQDLSTQSILIEMGGVDNTLEETYRSVEAFVEVFADFYWSTEPNVNVETARRDKGEESD
ncbi:stage II sporulation protein P [Halalkalibacterium ligniniphilum]|uniref:stage II sporulation protein P n=1 Tax=Halalkalibacterium ligniniphilum TaxID=1134413 RepID=UPI00034C84C0|nr:stage II sporulation protein P [Halalkalibacterium ligniniphilum]